MATHISILVWRIPCTEEPGELQSAAAAAKLLQSCSTLCDPIDGSPPGSRPWDSPGKNTGMGCHFLLQCMKVKSESEVRQSCPTLGDPMDCSPPGSSVHGIFQARILEWVAFPSPVDLPDPGIKPGLLHCRQILYSMSYREVPSKNQLYFNKK